MRRDGKGREGLERKGNGDITYRDSGKEVVSTTRFEVVDTRTSVLVLVMRDMRGSDEVDAVLVSS